MAFPTGPVDGGTLYTDEYGNVFIYNINNGAWEKYLGDEFGEPVLTSGATMFGDLVQTPSSSVRPQLPGELSINRVDDTKIQFRYQGGDLATHGFDMDLDCVEDVTQDLIITSDSVNEGNVFAQFGEVLEAQQDGQIAGGDQSSRTFMWERSDSIADGSLYIDTGITTETYTILESDRGKYLRRKDTWSGTGTCGGTFVQRSNAMPVVFQLPTPTAYFSFEKFGGTGSLVLTLTGPSIVYAIDNTGAWEPVENFTAGTRTISFNNSERKTYAFESENMTHFKWVAGDDNFNFTIDSRSLTPALNSLYQSFFNQPLFNQNVSFLQTTNVSNMDKAFADSPSFRGSPAFNTSNVTTAVSAFENCTALNRSFTLNISNLVNASRMFSNCENIANVRVTNGQKMTNTSYMFQNCKKFYGSASLEGSTNLTNARMMFANCYEYTGSRDNVRNWSLSNMVDAHGMFRYCRKFNPDISNSVSWQSMQKLRNASLMFQGCSSFDQYWIKDWHLTSCTNLARMFDGCTNMRSAVNNMITAAAQNTSRMFYGTREMVGLGSWSPHTQNITSMYAMFREYQCSRLWSTGDWNTQSLEPGGLDYFLFDSPAWENLTNWRVKRIPEAPTEFASSSRMNNGTNPKWGSNPPNFAYSKYAGAGKIGAVVNRSHPDRESGEGQPGDVLEPTYAMEGGDITNYRWRWDGGGQTSTHPNDPGTRTFTVTASDRGRNIYCTVTATNPDDGSTAEATIRGYTIAGSSRSRSVTAYSVTTTDNDKGESVQVNLEFTGTEPVDYYKMNNEGEDELVGTMMPGSPKVLSLPTGVWTWEGANMTAIDYSGSPEETDFFVHSVSYDPTAP